MAERVKSISVDKSDRGLVWAMIALSILGAADSLYLFIYKLTGASQMCLGNGGCHDVNFSPYAEIYGVPLSVIGLVAYIVMAAMLLLEPRIRLLKENNPLLLFGMTLIGVAFSAYLTYLELYVIHAVCPFCVTSAIVITLMFILAIIRLVKQTAA